MILALQNRQKKQIRKNTAKCVSVYLICITLVLHFALALLLNNSHKNLQSSKVDRF